jgi:Flp pilus assembly CpaE family ATPase
VPNRNLKKALFACKQAYDHVVVDAPCVSRDVAATLAGASSVVLLVFQPTAKDLHSVRAARDALLERGLPDSRILPVVNRYDKKHSSVTLNEVRDALGSQRLCTISSDYCTAVRCINSGRPLSESAPSSLLRRDIKQLIATLAAAPQPQLACAAGA